MKVSTAKKLVIMSYFMVPGMREILATATRIVYSGDTKRFLFPDGSVLESNKGHWKEMKNPKLEAAVRRFGNVNSLYGQMGAPKDGVVPGAYSIDARIFAPEDSAETAKPFVPETTARLQMEVIALQELLNQKDEQLDKASRPMVVRLDWWAVGLVALLVFAHLLGWV